MDEDEKKELTDRITELENENKELQSDLDDANGRLLEIKEIVRYVK